MGFLESMGWTTWGRGEDEFPSGLYGWLAFMVPGPPKQQTTNTFNRAPSKRAFQQEKHSVSNTPPQLRLLDRPTEGAVQPLWVFIARVVCHLFGALGSASWPQEVDPMWKMEIRVRLTLTRFILPATISRGPARCPSLSPFLGFWVSLLK